MSRALVKPADIIAAAMIVVLSLVFVFMSVPKAADTVEILCGGELIYRLDLGKDTTVRVNGVTVTVKQGKAYVSDSTCRDKVCVRTGSLEKAGDCAVCLPNGVSVSVVGRADTDAVTY